MHATELIVFPEHSAEVPQARSGAPGRNRARHWPVQAGLPATAGAFQSRLAVILAADMVGYSRHMSEDEAGTHARFTAIFRRVIGPAMARYDARLVKNTGDGFLAEFASATASVRCAVQFQDGIRVWNGRQGRGRSLQFRVGINLGDVIVEPYDVFGHSVNVAARLEALAEPGGILVSHAVSASVRDPTLSFEDVGELALKNMAETVRSFRVLPRRGIGSPRNSRAASS